MDRLTAAKRSWNMSRIRSRDTKPEKVARSILHGVGFRFSLNRRDLLGNPDIVLPKYRTVIFVHGCFWHQHRACAEASSPKTRKSYWTEKLAKNVARDRINKRELIRRGWRVIILWECMIEKKKTRVTNILKTIKTADGNR